MIVFVDLRGQVPDYRFSFWDTEAENYVCDIDRKVAWYCVEDIESGVFMGDERLELVKLCPEWARLTPEEKVNYYP